jgi:hypothetical protein
MHAQLDVCVTVADTTSRLPRSTFAVSSAMAPRGSWSVNVHTSTFAIDCPDSMVSGGAVA